MLYDLVDHFLGFSADDAQIRTGVRAWEQLADAGFVLELTETGIAICDEAGELVTEAATLPQLLAIRDGICDLEKGR